MSAPALAVKAIAHGLSLYNNYTQHRYVQGTLLAGALSNSLDQILPALFAYDNGVLSARQQREIRNNATNEISQLFIDNPEFVASKWRLDNGAFPQFATKDEFNAHLLAFMKTLINVHKVLNDTTQHVHAITKAKSEEIQRALLFYDKVMSDESTQESFFNNTSAPTVYGLDISECSMVVDMGRNGSTPMNVTEHTTEQILKLRSPTRIYDGQPMKLDPVRLPHDLNHIINSFEKAMKANAAFDPSGKPYKATDLHAVLQPVAEQLAESFTTIGTNVSQIDLAAFNKLGRVMRDFVGDDAVVPSLLNFTLTQMVKLKNASGPVGVAAVDIAGLIRQLCNDLGIQHIVREENDDIHTARQTAPANSSHNAPATPVATPEQATIVMENATQTLINLAQHSRNSTESDVEPASGQQSLWDMLVEMLSGIFASSDNSTALVVPGNDVNHGFLYRIYKALIAPSPEQASSDVVVTQSNSIPESQDAVPANSLVEAIMSGLSETLTQVVHSASGNSTNSAVVVDQQTETVVQQQTQRTVADAVTEFFHSVRDVLDAVAGGLSGLVFDENSYISLYSPAKTIIKCVIIVLTFLGVFAVIIGAIAFYCVRSTWRGIIDDLKGFLKETISGAFSVNVPVNVNVPLPSNVQAPTILPPNRQLPALLPASDNDLSHQITIYEPLPNIIDTSNRVVDVAQRGSHFRRLVNWLKVSSGFDKRNRKMSEIVYENASTMVDIEQLLRYSEKAKETEIAMIMACTACL